MNSGLNRRKAIARIMVGFIPTMILVNPVKAFSGVLNNNKQHHILITDLEYLPKIIKVSIGDRITWTNKDIIPHTVTASDDSWDSKLLNQGEQWHLDITSNLDLTYYCRYHPLMRAAIEIIE